MVSFRDLLRSHQEPINRLNVYPVPDGDTGTNMALTMESVVSALADVPAGDMAAACTAIGHGALMGGRGNSGVILSQVLRAMTGRCAGGPEAGPLVVAEALVAASASAYEAVNRPVEGTILTVLREASAAADLAAGGGADLAGVFDAARVAGADALARTPELLPVLKEAGVVDAGGAGFLLLLDAALHVVAGRPLPEPPAVQEPTIPIVAHGGGGHEASDLRYEVMYLLEADDSTVPVFKEVWAGIGDSIVVVGGDGLWNCHIHTDDIGAAVEAALDAGRPRNIRVTDLIEQVEEERWVREAEGGDDDLEPVHPVTCAVVAVATGDGVRRILRSFGVHRIVAGGQTMNPSVADLLEAVEAVPAADVIVLPNNKNIVPVALQVDALTTKTVRVVPTRGIAEGFAALVAYDPDARADPNALDMQKAAEAVVAGEVTRAVRDSTADGVAITTGDWLGIARDGIKVVDQSLSDAVTRLLGELVDPDHELVTLVEGEGASVGDTRHVTEWLHENHPDLAVEVHHGGQLLYPYLIGIE